MITINFLLLFLILSSISYGQTKIDPDGGFDLKDYESDKFNVFGSGHTPKHYGFTLISEDKDFEYYNAGDGQTTYKLFKRPRPVLNHRSSQEIRTGNLKWPGVMEFHSDDLGDIQPNCTEEKFTFKEFKAIALNPSVKTKVDFLQSIPKRSLQKFTFIHSSRSLQRHGVSYENPRVMRFSADGKFVLTYNVGEESVSKDTIEAIFFDDKERRFNFVHLKFGETKPKLILNHKSCLSCHGGNDPRPNWAQYDKWDGVYGSQDDLLGYSLENDYKIISKEKKEYENFRKLHADNIELTSLPWPDLKSSAYETYPYITTYKLANYNFRPNAHYTIASSRLNAQRLARKFQEHPLYSKMKWSILAESLRCNGNYVDSKNPIFNALISDYLDLDMGHGYVYRNSPSQILYKIGKAFKFSDADWHLDFNFGKDPTDRFYNFDTAQWELSDFVQSVLFTDLTKEEPELLKHDVRVNRMSALFGKNFSCLDDIADKLWVNQRVQPQICEIINRKVEEEVKNIPLDFKLNEDQNHKGKIHYWIGYDRESTYLPTPGAGKKIAQKTCGQCHNGEVLNLNLADEASLSKTLKDGPGYKQIIEQMIGSKNNCEMPPKIAGKCLSTIERNALMNYINSFIKN